MAQNSFELTALKALTTDPGAKRIVLIAAMIKVLALSMARQAPELREDALRIVDYVGKLYEAMPTRASIAAVVEAYEARAAPRSSASPARWRRDDLVEALWEHFQAGK